MPQDGSAEHRDTITTGARVSSVLPAETAAPSSSEPPATATAPAVAAVRLRPRCALAVWTVSLLLAAGCSTQAPYAAPSMQVPQAWSESVASADPAAAAGADAWWSALRDPAIDTLIAAALADSPTLAQAVAHVEEARAALGRNAAQRLPMLSLSANAMRGRSLQSASSASTVTGSSASAGLGLSWELDLFGRVRDSVAAAQERLHARSEDARSTRLALAAEVASAVVTLRACAYSQEMRAADIASRTRTLAMTRQRLLVGFLAPVDEALAISNLASAGTAYAVQQQQCERQIHALSALTGWDDAAVRVQVRGAPLRAAAEASVPFMPTPPAPALALPASVLAAHPDVRAAEREAAAAWADIGVARAARLSRVDLGALLTGNWLGAAGSSLNYTGWSLGPSLIAPLFDGGAGAAGVDAAEARYRAAAAELRQTARRAARDVEDALAACASAQTRLTTTRDAVDAARTTFIASEARWQAGAVSLFELEDARRQLASAEDSVIAALRDRAQSWIALIKASGNTVISLSSTPTNSSSHAHLKSSLPR